MISYKGKSFCSQKCANRECSRNFNDEVRAHAKKWWGEDDPPICMNDFKTDDCGFVEVEHG